MKKMDTVFTEQIAEARAVCALVERENDLQDAYPSIALPGQSSDESIEP